MRILHTTPSTIEDLQSVVISKMPDFIGNKSMLVASALDRLTKHGLVHKAFYLERGELLELTQERGKVLMNELILPLRRIMRAAIAQRRNQ